MQPIDLYIDLAEFINLAHSDFDLKPSGGVYFSLANSGRRGGQKWFNLGLIEILDTFRDIQQNLVRFQHSQDYAEKDWRDLAGDFFRNETARSLMTVQTKPMFTMFSKIIDWANGQEPSAYSDERINLNQKSLALAIEKIQQMVDFLSPQELARKNGEQEKLKMNPHKTAEPPPQIDLAFAQAILTTGFRVS